MSRGARNPILPNPTSRLYGLLIMHRGAVGIFNGWFISGSPVLLGSSPLGRLLSTIQPKPFRALHSRFCVLISARLLSSLNSSSTKVALNAGFGFMSSHPFLDLSPVIIHEFITHLIHEKAFFFNILSNYFEFSIKRLVYINQYFFSKRRSSWYSSVFVQFTSTEVVTKDRAHYHFSQSPYTLVNKPSSTDDNEFKKRH